MDFVLDFCDEHFLDSVWAKILPVHLPPSSIPALAARELVNGTFKNAPALDLSSAMASAGQTVSAWGRDDWRRQAISLYVLVYIGIHLLYFIVATFSYFVLYDKRMEHHPRFLKNQKWMEIKYSLQGFPVLDILTLPWFLGEVRGYSKLYKSIDACPWGGGWAGVAYTVLSSAFFLWFTDLAIYFIHRGEHHPRVYKHIHKPHHKWVIPTPFAAFAFHPLDGYAQSLPYHVFVFLFPIHRYQYLGLFVFVNLWTIAIHDSDMIVDHPLEHIINGPAHHTLHHIWFTCNYGQYFTWADKVGGSYRHPAKDDDPLLEVIRAKERKEAAKALLKHEKDLAIARYEESQLRERKSAGVTDAE